MEAIIIIPAIKKKVAFTNDLVKQLAGISLIQRVIEKAKKLNAVKSDTYLITDSEEISLVAKRNGINLFYNKDLGLQVNDILDSIKNILLKSNGAHRDIVILSPYSPLIDVAEIQRAYNIYENDKSQFLIPVMHDFQSIYEHEKRCVNEIISGKMGREIFIESKAFQIFSGSHILNNNQQIKTAMFALSQNLIEISDYHDWWVCEKLLKRKRIIFRIIGGGKFGMGHIYRSLALAQMITDHEVRFVCDLESKPAADKLLGYLYWLGVYESNEIEDQIISMRPDLVVNDMLDTSQEYIQRLHDHGIKAVNFEDLGSGAVNADLTINELYDNPVIPGHNILWGHEYSFVRDEFDAAKTHHFAEKISYLLITFGGADPSDFTRRVLKAVTNFCKENKIKIIIVTGPGYLYINELKKDISEINTIDIEYTHSTGIMSSIMERTEIAITSNGRTVYEMAHMNIPSIILSHHERENTHFFAKEENGFIPIGIYEGREKEEQMLGALNLLVRDAAYRRLLFDRMKHFRFDKNKKKIEKLLLDVLEKEI